MSNLTFLTVQALTKYVKRKFDADPHLRNVYVKGELSNVKLHPSGHIYFTLKDDKTRIQAAMFRSRSNTLQFKPENGMNVLITGDVTVFETAGSYQLYVQTMEPDGIGALYLAFEQLKKKLQQEGLFEERFKQPIPQVPQRIGLITAESGAALRDMYSTINRRFPMAEMYLFPALVQGRTAVPSIVKAIEQANEMANVDVLIVGRGGGSIEDLWAFNEEDVARAIFSSRIPIISAVGHETDTTIADFVSDLRAPTPTAAAEMAVPDQLQLFQHLKNQQRSIYLAVQTLIKQLNKRLETAQAAYPLQYPERLYRPFIEKLDNLEDRLQRSSEAVVQGKRMNFDRLYAGFQYYTPIRRIQLEQQQTKQLEMRLSRAAEHTIKQRQQQFVALMRMMQALNPLQVMERGFSIGYKDHEVIKSINDVASGDQVTLQLADGSISTIVEGIIPKEVE
ncbi:MULTISPECIES: exodeoxyribonuclease VII large subunit [unclassified Sporosarcina]|uniref:exodeoxyribonuclease VII large subunit n=1 Tax=unclassified Sporosarcina TaxID=2647733 RepID=UPI000C170995|nr:MULTISPECIES: exodeoxyribonuclease VII large subunit [unclassified Sporosarcina]PID06618.1 exodeoxyribonuclease VII large subunit [Sporosarcina sp. P30]PID09812.1 exodeoxyribonuclease VII large subunit [Sporosarcina sp. P31]PID13391.1 exodeoxyribonuclease VII large subunit [Sporosarcina sp. P32b]